MTHRIKTKTTFDPSKTVRPIFTRGNVAVSRDGRILASCVEEDVLVTDLWNGGEELARIEGDGEIITSLCMTPSASHLILCSRSLSMRIYALAPSPTPELKTEPQLLRTLKPHLAPVIVTTVDDSGTLLATGGADGVIKVWDIRGGFVTHTFHGHSGVVSALHFFQVPVFNTTEELKQGKKRKKKPAQEDEIEEEDKGTLGYRLASGGEDGKVRIWNLHKQRSSSAAVSTLDSHVSILRSISYCPEENALLSAGRDRTVILWDMRTWKIRLTIPVLEEVETAGFLAEGSVIYSGGETARLRLWALDSGREITKPQKHGAEIEAIQDSILLPELNCLLLVQADQTLTFYDTKKVAVPADEELIEPLKVLRRICGTHGQIIDIAYVGPAEQSFLALATNSEDVRIISVSMQSQQDQSAGSLFHTNYFGADFAILKGHSDIVLTMDVDWSGHWLATGAKDNTARLWRLDTASNDFTCHAILTGHAESISAIALPHQPPPADTPAFDEPLFYPPEFLVTGSSDKTIKRWDLPRLKAKAANAPRAVYTRKAHDKDINALAVHFSGKYFASASLDRTVKIWDAEEGVTIGLLRGHKRGIWSVAFSPAGTHLTGASTSSALKGYAATGAGDRSVRIWNLADFTCLMTLEGHNGGVLKVIWLPPSTSDDEERPPMVASAAADGLVKIWNVNNGECESTLDNHTDRVWALAVCPSQHDEDQPLLISGGADAVLTFWKDTTRLAIQKALEDESKRVETDQKLDNLVKGKSYREAIGLALHLDRPGVLYELFKSACDHPDNTKRTRNNVTKATFTGLAAVDEALSDLSDGQIFKLLMRLREWNANGRKELVAQRVLRCLVNTYSMERLAGLKPWIDGADKQPNEHEDIDTADGQRRRKPAKGNASLVEVLDGLRTWTERHHARAVELWDESFLVEFTLREMDALDLDEMNVEDVVPSNGVNGHYDS